MKRILWIALIQCLLLLASARDVSARERRSFYSGIRCQSMGGACIAVTNDETALLVNPAALGKLRDFYGTIFDPEIEVGYHTQGLYQEQSFSNPYSLEDLLGALDKKRSAYYHSKLQLFPSFVGRNFGIGILGNYLLDAEMSGDGTTIDTYYRNDVAFVLGFNFRFFDGRVKLGFNTKVINRIEVDNTALSATGSLAYDAIASEGVGLSNDVGLILTAPWKLLPTISAVVHDVGGTSFDQASGVRMSTTNRPNSVPQDVDVAVAIFPIHSNALRAMWSVEYRGLLTSQDEEDKAKLIHAGMELNYGDVFFFRAGYNQRYWTAGLEISSERFQVQVGSYGEEVGTVAENKEDRRYAIKCAYRF